LSINDRKAAQSRIKINLAVHFSNQLTAHNSQLQAHIATMSIKTLLFLAMAALAVVSVSAQTEARGREEDSSTFLDSFGPLFQFPLYDSCDARLLVDIFSFSTIFSVAVQLTVLAVTETSPSVIFDITGVPPVAFGAFEVVFSSLPGTQPSAPTFLAEFSGTVIAGSGEGSDFMLPVLCTLNPSVSNRQATADCVADLAPLEEQGVAGITIAGGIPLEKFTLTFTRNYACSATALVFVGSDVTKGSGTVAGEAVVSSNQQNVFAGQKTFFRSG
jgi:hypothetical protein